MNAMVMVSTIPLTKAAAAEMNADGGKQTGTLVHSTVVYCIDSLYSVAWSGLWIDSLQRGEMQGTEVVMCDWGSLCWSTTNMIDSNWKK